MKTEMFFSISVTRNSLKFMKLLTGTVDIAEKISTAAPEVGIAAADSKLLSIDFALHSYNTNMRLVQ